jgi:hypothetical protein
MRGIAANRPRAGGRAYDAPGTALMLAMILIAAMPVSPFPAGAQPARGADAIESYTLGTGPKAGYGIEYLPGSVLGFPDTTARWDVATIDPKQVFGLGLGGVIVVRFDRPIADRPGPDFTVFENAFHYVMSGKERIYAEPGAVAVSRDGVEYIEYPFDSLTLAGCAGVTPTNGERDPADPTVSGGDSFDLAALGIDSVRYVRIRDVTGFVLANRDHPFWDFTLTGFELDAVVALRGEGGSSSVGSGSIALGAAIHPNPIAGMAAIRITLDRAATVGARLFDGLGGEVRSIAGRTLGPGRHGIPLDVTGLPDGLYLIAIDIDGRPTEVLRAVIVR